MRSLIGFISNVLYIVEICVLIDVVLSWIPINENAFTDLIHKISAPFLEPGRKIQDRLIPNTPVDLSPILALVIIRIIRSILFIY